MSVHTGSRLLGLFLGAVSCLALSSTSIAQTKTAERLHEPNAKVFRQMLESPNDDQDLAKAKVTIDHMIDPSIDVDATLNKLDALAMEIRLRFPVNVSSRQKLDTLRTYLHQPGPWNENRPYQYDLNDPLGYNIQNKLLSTYLVTRKGNCISMPLFFIVLGQKLGLDVTAATAPQHVFVKYRDDDGQWYNIETTSGAGFSRDVWMRQQHQMTEQAIASGIYMRPLTRKETISVMLGTLLEFYQKKGFHERRVALAQLILRHDPKDVSAILHEHSAFLAWWKEERPKNNPTELMHLQISMDVLLEQATSLGWRPSDDATESQYRETIRRAKLAQ